MKKICIVEDDINIANELKELLQNSGYNAAILTNFNRAEEDTLAQSPDLVLLDINIPVLNGELLLKEIRKTSSVPVIMVTSRSSDLDEATSIMYGADDYIVKPYNPTILLLRINNIFKRTNDYQEMLFHGLKINLKKGIIASENKQKNLTKNEIIVLSYLLENQNRIVKREELMTELWNNDEYINDNALTVNISRLRTKLADLGLENAIETRIGIGYILI